MFETAKDILKKNNIRITSEDFNRPWGGFIVVHADDLKKFIATFFSELPENILSPKANQPLSPKLLIVNAHKRLSWQYHHRRSELWKVIHGEVTVATSFTDIQETEKIYHKNQIIVLENGQRHRLIGLEFAGIVAEIWQHTNPEHLSDEDDIVRLQDDFGR